MAAEKAIVCFEGSGKIITNNVNGILVKNKDVHALAKAMHALIQDDELRSKLGKNAKDLVLQNYSWDMLCLKLSDIYSSLN